MTAGWLAASVLAGWSAGTALDPRSLLSISLLLLSLTVLWLSVTGAAIVGLTAGAVSLLMGSTAVEQAVFLLLMSGICAFFSVRLIRWVFLGLTTAWFAWYSSLMHETASQILALGTLLILLCGVYNLGLGTRRLREKQEQSNRELDDAKQRQREALAAERRSLARDLHDVVAHDITVISMQAELGQLGQDMDLTHRTLSNVGESCRTTLEDLRRIVTVLTEGSDETSDPTDAGAGASESRLTLGAGLKKFITELESLGIPVTTEWAGTDPSSPRVERAAYRILQECCTNVIKYGARGPDATCTISVDSSGGAISLRVMNSVRSASQSLASPHFSSEEGLGNIRKRASEFNGHVEAGLTSTGTWETQVLNLRET